MPIHTVNIEISGYHAIPRAEIEVNIGIFAYHANPNREIEVSTKFPVIMPIRTERMKFLAKLESSFVNSKTDKRSSLAYKPLQNKEAKVLDRKGIFAPLFCKRHGWSYHTSSHI